MSPNGPATLIARFEALLTAGTDGAALRFGLAQAYLRSGESERAIGHLERALEQDPDYSAAWKLLARTCADSGRIEAAISAYERGIEVALRRGDKQAAREMEVFLKRLLKGRDGPART